MEKICIKNKYEYDKNFEEHAIYGRRIIEYLKTFGGDNDGWTGINYSNFYYYIDNDNIIQHSKRIPEGYTPIDLDNIEPINDNLKECFIKIIDKINKNNSL